MFHVEDRFRSVDTEIASEVENHGTVVFLDSKAVQGLKNRR